MRQRGGERGAGILEGWIPERIGLARGGGACVCAAPARLRSARLGSSCRPGLPSAGCAPR